MLGVLSVNRHVPAVACLGPTAVQPHHLSPPLIRRMEDEMCGTEAREQLPLISSPASGCGCCSNETDGPAPTTSGGAAYALEGLTCGHCVKTVEKAVGTVNGVTAASVDLVPGGRSRLVVQGTASASAVHDAVASAGYTLAGS
ncbi:heavy-metal-associated domain-containing protein [Arthrobacter sp. MP_2.3]|uniref:heavy-metal-associated domain-containing protein n=1 Tax=Arthrobacter sp. MP_2.3 TaxID=3349633 RepID=UPI0038D36273